MNTSRESPPINNPLPNDPAIADPRTTDLPATGSPSLPHNLPNTDNPSPAASETLVTIGDAPLPTDSPLNTTASSIRHGLQDGAVRLLPTLKQWQHFSALLEHARGLGAEGNGFCKVLLPEGASGRTLAKSVPTKRPSHQFSFGS